MRLVKRRIVQKKHRFDQEIDRLVFLLQNPYNQTQKITGRPKLPKYKNKGIARFFN